MADAPDQVPIVATPPAAFALQHEAPQPDESRWRGLPGLGASVVVHLGALLWLLGAFAGAKELPETHVIPVELVQPKETPPQPPPTPRQADRPKASEQAGKAPKPAQPARPKATEPRPKAPPLSRFTGAFPPASSSADASGIGLVDGSRATSITQDQLESIRSQLERCWQPPTGWTDPRQASVVVRFLLKKDGSLDGKPVVVEFPASLLGKQAGDNAIAAIEQCGPYHLPADKYNQWHDVQMRFTPSR